VDSGAEEAMRGPSVGICEWCQKPATSILDFLEVSGVRKTVCMACQHRREACGPEKFVREWAKDRELGCTVEGCGNTTLTTPRDGWTVVVTFANGIKAIHCPEHVRE
jgi:hypothetical protein